MDYLVINLMSLAVFLLANVPLIYGAHQLARKLAGNFMLRLALGIFIYLVQGSLIFLLLGSTGLLHEYWAIAAGVVSGISLTLLSGKLPEKQIPFPPEAAQNSYFDRIFLLTAGLLCIIFMQKAAYLTGTDTMLYHLFYPAMWINYGQIKAVTLLGLPHEYFPFCGECMYGWLMLTGSEIPFYALLQSLAMTMSLAAMTGFWQQYKVSRFFCKSSIIWLCATGIIFENVNLCYSDTLCGAFFTAGIIFILLTLQRSDELTSGQRWLFALFSGIAMGFCAAIKYSGLILAPLTTLALLIWCAFRHYRLQKFSRMIPVYCLLMISAVVGGTMFYLANYLKSGNLFYPVKIPFIFSNGIDFERPPVVINQLWSFFVNASAWSMSWIQAIFFLAILLLSILAYFLKKTKVFQPDTENLTAVITPLAIILTAVEAIMIAIYPAMTQARSAIPFLLAAALLLPPLLQLFIGNRINTPRKELIFTILTAITAFLLLCQRYQYQCYLLLAGVAILIMFLAGIKRQKLLRAIYGIVIFIALLSLSLCWYIRRAATDELADKFYNGETAAAIKFVRHLHKVNKYQPLKIASSGCWFNYNLLLDMPGNLVECVPVNKLNTVHPHEVKSLEELRGNEHVDYALWLDRLRQGKYNILLIDLGSSQDFPLNRELELKWAQAHPEIFIPVVTGENIHLFLIRKY